MASQQVWICDVTVQPMYATCASQVSIFPQSVNAQCILSGLFSLNIKELKQTCKSHDHDHQWADYVMT